MVYERDLAEIGPSLVLRVVRRRWRIRRVGIENVNPREPAAALPADPCQRGGDDLVRRTLGEREVGVVAGTPETIVVDVEAAVEPEAPLEGNAADERACRKAVLFQEGRDRGGAGT